MHAEKKKRGKKMIVHPLLFWIGIIGASIGMVLVVVACVSQHRLNKKYQKRSKEEKGGEKDE